jgi:hypothetical protein
MDVSPATRRRYAAEAAMARAQGLPAVPVRVSRVSPPQPPAAAQTYTFEVPVSSRRVSPVRIKNENEDAITYLGSQRPVGFVSPPKNRGKGKAVFIPRSPIMHRRLSQPDVGAAGRAASAQRVPPMTEFEYICPITQELMHDPVHAEDGFAYEHEAILNYFNYGQNVLQPSVKSLKTQQPMFKRLTRIFDYIKQYETWCRANGKPLPLETTQYGTIYNPYTCTYQPNNVAAAPAPARRGRSPSPQRAPAPAPIQEQALVQVPTIDVPTQNVRPRSPVEPVAAPPTTNLPIRILPDRRRYVTVPIHAHDLPYVLTLLLPDHREPDISVYDRLASAFSSARTAQNVVQRTATLSKDDLAQLLFLLGLDSVRSSSVVHLRTFFAAWLHALGHANVHEYIGDFQWVHEENNDPDPLLEFTFSNIHQPTLSLPLRLTTSMAWLLWRRTSTSATAVSLEHFLGGLAVSDLRRLVPMNRFNVNLPTRANKADLVRLLLTACETLLTS